MEKMIDITENTAENMNDNDLETNIVTKRKITVPKLLTTDYKSKFISLLGTFELFALIMLILTPYLGLAMVSRGVIDLVVSPSISLGSSYIFEYNSLISFIPITAIFFIFYSVRNTQYQAFIYGSSKKVHFMSNLLAGVTYSALFTVIAFIAELILVFIMYNVSDFLTIIPEYYLTASKILIATIPNFLVCICAFFIINITISKQSQKQYFKAALPVLILIVYALIISIIFLSLQIVFDFNWKSLSILSAIFALILGGLSTVDTFFGGVER